MADCDNLLVCKDVAVENVQIRAVYCRILNLTIASVGSTISGLGLSSRLSLIEATIYEDFYSGCRRACGTERGTKVTMNLSTAAGLCLERPKV